MSTVVALLFTAYVGVALLVTLPPLWVVLLVMPAGRRADRLVRLWSRFIVRASLCPLRVSGLEHLVKPDPRLYRVFCERYGLAPEGCVLIDDSEPNVVSARKFGMQAIHFEGDAKALRKELIELGLPLKKK